MFTEIEIFRTYPIKRNGWYKPGMNTYIEKSRLKQFKIVTIIH